MVEYNCCWFTKLKMSFGESNSQLIYDVFRPTLEIGIYSVPLFGDQVCHILGRDGRHFHGRSCPLDSGQIVEIIVQYKPEKDRIKSLEYFPINHFCSWFCRQYCCQDDIVVFTYFQFDLVKDYNADRPASLRRDSP